jgi:MHS family proline/betaine transporter-like MFS transporter
VAPSEPEFEAVGGDVPVGTTIEYYDYGIFGYPAVVLSPLFFPSDNEAASRLSTSAVFGPAFVARPLGGIVLGRLGDKLGRRAILLFTVLAMGLASGLSPEG